MDEDLYAGENDAGPSALLEVAMDGEDGDGNENCVVQCESRSKRPTAKDKGKGEAKSESAEATPVSQTRRPKKNVCSSDPSVHHRLRTVPLYSHPGRTERLTS